MDPGQLFVLAFVVVIVVLLALADFWKLILELALVLGTAYGIILGICGIFLGSFYLMGIGFAIALVGALINHKVQKGQDKPEP